MKRIRNEVNKEKVREISKRYGVDLLTASILERRGLTEPEDLKFFFESHLRYMHNPFDFIEMEDAVDRILAAIETKEKILVYGDRDVDGITATVILVSTLKQCGAEVLYAVPEGDEDYSLRKADIDKYTEQGVSLIITVDCGISCVEETRYAYSAGVDLIVTDHHNPGETIPSAVAVIDPKIEDSGYPYPYIAGCVVALKLSFAVLFGKTAFYNRPMILMNIFNGNDGFYFIEIQTLRNLCITDEYSFTVHPDHSNEEEFEAITEICGQGTVYFYDSSYQLEILSKVFPEEIPMNAVDLFDEINKYVPEASRFSLFKLKSEGVFSRYESDSSLKEIDVFQCLFISYFYKKFSSLFSHYYYCMDLAALGTVSDVMPLHNENRIIVKTGIDLINKKKRASLRELLYRQNCFTHITSIDIAFKISPVLNAAGRMGVPEKAVRFLLSEDPEEIRRLASEILALNEERKQIGNDAWIRILPKAELCLEKTKGKFIFLYDSELNRGITGIMAMRLSQKYKVPAIVTALVDNKKLVGSLRTTGQLKARSFLEKFSDLFNDFGGHDGAAGFNLDAEKGSLFGKRLTEAIGQLDIRPEEDEIVIDALLPAARMTPEIMNTVDFLAPFGEGMSEPVFCCDEAVIAKCETIGAERQHVKLTLKIGENFWPALFWNASDLINIEFAEGDTVSVVFTLNRNTFKNDIINQMIIKDLIRIGS